MIGRAVRREGLTAVGWSIRSFDTMGHPVEQTLERVISRLHDGAVILLHDNREQADVLLEKIIAESKARGYEFCTIEELFKP